MTTKTKERGGIVVRHHAPVVPKKKFEAIVQARNAAAKRARETASERMGALVGLGACAGVGYLERTGRMPSTFGLEPTAVIGLALAFGVPMVAKGKLAQAATEAGLAIAGVAAYKLGAGAPLKVGGEEEEDGF